MHKNAIKKGGRVNFWKNIDYKKPETRPEPVMSNPNPTRTRRNISKPDPTRTQKKFQNPNPTQTRHLATRPITMPTSTLNKFFGPKKMVEKSVSFFIVCVQDVPLIRTGVKLVKED